MSQIKPIETEYNGLRFRSRLEARWAVFFDAAGIKYQYEPEGYEMGDGTKYLPDFFLPDLNYYVEVKGKNDHLESDLIKLKKFVFESKSVALILSDIPFDKESKGLFFFPIMYYSARSGGHVAGCHCFFMHFKREHKTIIQDDYAIGRRIYFFFDNKNSNECMYRKIQAKYGSVYDDFGDFPPLRDDFGEYLIPIESMMIKARQARFEHGEKPW